MPSRWITEKLYAHPWLNNACREALERKHAAVGTPEFVVARDACTSVFRDTQKAYVSKVREDLKKLVPFRADGSNSVGLSPLKLRVEITSRLYDQAKKTDKARELVEAAVKAAPDDAVVRLGAANWFLTHGDTVAARENGDKAIDLDPKNLEARIVNGTIARVARDFESASKFFGEAHAQSPRNFVASDSLALSLAELPEKENIQRALEIAETNVAMVKDNQQLQIASLTTLSWVLYKLGRMADAEKILAQVSQNNSLTADGAYYIAQILSDKGEKEQAQRLLEQLMTNDPIFANRAAAEELQAALKAEAEASAK